MGEEFRPDFGEQLTSADVEGQLKAHRRIRVGGVAGGHGDHVQDDIEVLVPGLDVGDSPYELRDVVVPLGHRLDDLRDVEVAAVEGAVAGVVGESLEDVRV